MTSYSDRLKTFPIGEFSRRILNWYENNKRPLPWREDKDPYRIWVSEIMLQQTQVDTVKPYFENFMNKFPTPEALAEAEEAQVMKAWEGLGYYSRARNLQSAVKEVVQDYGGEIPKSPENFASLKGVGPYTKGAVMSIAYDLEEPAVDGNVMRVLARVLLIGDDIGKQRTRRQVEDDVRMLMAGTSPADFNQALMELGALVCTPKNPDCDACPVKNTCRAYQRSMVHALPVKAKKKKQQRRTMAAVVIENEKGEILVEQRPDKGLLAGMWQFPMVEATPDLQQVALNDYLKEAHQVDVELTETEQRFDHVFSHLIWDIHVFRGTAHVQAASPNGKWLTKTEAKQLAFSVSHQKIWEEQL
ncbi:A/G-specific adenine glycosylase [Salicibibacter cibarius]|uniref:Adenine DNA glycosylase n=1 Tax=Salicibibacter cibarius TaxID=2743000 RepID=A0A7T7CB74_9BACI|nr:A/G-specific adenine glycosylase [Salicibibacter cibarius]QQK75573.1 A/G-specific adenine glycosylase [Salicibibacter cibarius]